MNAFLAQDSVQNLQAGKVLGEVAAKASPVGGINKCPPTHLSSAVLQALFQMQAAESAHIAFPSSQHDPNELPEELAPRAVRSRDGSLSKVLGRVAAKALPVGCTDKFPLTQLLKKDSLQFRDTQEP